MKDSNPQLMYRSRIFEVYEEDVSMPDGRVVRQSRIEHKPTIAVVPVDPAGRIILIRQYRSAVRQYLLEIPAGTLDKADESIEQCVQRELAEETGFKSGRLVKLYEGYLVPGYCDEYMHFYLALDLFEEKLPSDEDEFIETVFTTVEEALSMIRDGSIKDSKTALGILLASGYLNGKQAIRQTESSWRK
ncbi:MAG: NUDIX hydrolase [Syntrophales bacterium]